MRISDWSSDVCSSDLDFIVLLDGHLDQIGPGRRSSILEVVRNCYIIELRAQRFILPHDGAIFDQINQADEIAFKADRKIKNQRTRAQTILDHVNTPLEIRTGAIRLVDETTKSEDRRVGKVG